MEIITPPTYVFECKCGCGAHFIATEKDFKKLNIRVIDPYYSDNAAWGDSTMFLDFEVLQCPFCGRYVVKKYSSLEDIKKHNDFETSQLFDHDVNCYFDADKEKYDKIQVEAKNWKDIKYLAEKYKYGIDSSIRDL